MLHPKYGFSIFSKFVIPANAEIHNQNIEILETKKFKNKLNKVAAFTQKLCFVILTEQYRFLHSQE
ncbi:hypothetical protein GCM10007963_10220 [Lutibacter litoralis]|nr:hypothetical protein GCM10007963_10220 [Lutibacter litoralis]